MRETVQRQLRHLENANAKNDAWDYANEECVKPTAAETSQTEIAAWIKGDNMYSQIRNNFEYLPIGIETSKGLHHSSRSLG
jgi:precorrin-6B methylase 1